jgi:hypothetical protein
LQPIGVQKVGQRDFVFEVDERLAHSSAAAAARTLLLSPPLLTVLLRRLRLRLRLVIREQQLHQQHARILERVDCAPAYPTPT